MMTCGHVWAFISCRGIFHYLTGNTPHAWTIYTQNALSSTFIETQSGDVCIQYLLFCYSGLFLLPAPNPGEGRTEQEGISGNTDDRMQREINVANRGLWVSFQEPAQAPCPIEKKKSFTFSTVTNSPEKWASPKRAPGNCDLSLGERLAQ